MKNIEDDFNFEDYYIHEEIYSFKEINEDEYEEVMTEIHQLRDTSKYSDLKKSKYRQINQH